MKTAGDTRLLLSVGLLLASLGVRAQNDVVFRAMHDEMQRSMQKLQLENLEKPYFISYRVIDNESTQINAALGSLIYRSQTRARILTVSVRVGDYALDSSNFVGGGMQFAAGLAALPLDDNYDELRRQIWLATDTAYKKALEDLSGKRAALQNVTRTDDTPDFSNVTPVSITEMAPHLPLDLNSASQYARAGSALFRKAPWIQTSRVQLSVSSVLQRYLNSEGSTFTRATPRVSLRVLASTQASDGSPLSDFITCYGYSMRDLPSESVLSSQIVDLQRRLKNLQAAPSQSRYNGPVLFEGQAAAEVFAHHFAALLPVEPAGTSNTQAQPSLPAGLLGRLNARVLPEFLSVVDDPTVTHQGGDILFGAYKVDEEAVPSRPTTVVEHGILKALLTSRAPVQGIATSSANMRERGVAPSNLFVKSDKALPSAELTRRLVESSRTRGNDYGIVIRRLSGDSVTLAYRVYADGHEELVRNAKVEGLDERSFKDITDVSDQGFVYTDTAPLRRGPVFTTGVGVQPLVSYVVPSLLFDDATVVKASEKTPKLPIASNPLMEAQ